MQMKHAVAKATRLLGISIFVVAVASPFTASSQEAEEGEEGLDSAESAPEPEAAAPELEEQESSEPGLAAPPAPPPPPPAPPAPPPSPFSLAVKGFVSGSIMVQDNPTGGGGTGNTTLFGPTNLTTDKWWWGGDVRQSQLKFFITGPELIGARPTAGFDFDLLGGNQINSVPGMLAPIPNVDSMGMVMPGTSFAPIGTSAQGDENLLPRVRLAYLELNWNNGADIVRIGQYHNLIVPMIAASLSHIGAPLGYGAGQLGWRAPGITYLHDFALSDTTKLSAGIQLNRNNWADNVPSCAGGAGTSPTNNCLPSGVSLAEASGLPQVQARLLLSGPPKPSPFPMYAPNAWQVHLVGVWDQKDASGLGMDPAMGANDTLTTMVASAGFKVTLGPLLVAGHGWYGKNAGSMFGHIFQMQHPQAGDINGFGGWGQVGFSLTPQLAIWVFGGIDKPNQDDILSVTAKSRGFGAGLVQNAQLAGMISFVAGPLAFSLEYLRVMSDLAVQPPGMATMITSSYANQIAFTGAMFF